MNFRQSHAWHCTGEVYLNRIAGNVAGPESFQPKIPIRSMGRDHPASRERPQQSMRLGLITLLLVAAAQPALAQTIEPAQVDVRLTLLSHRCGSNENTTDIVVCGRNDSQRFRLPFPDEREGSGDDIVRGEIPRASLYSGSSTGCGIFNGQRPCSKSEAADRGYGGGRDPITFLGRLFTKVVDPDSDTGPPPKPVPKPKP
jgi:hypothetical protein